jgi:hypothetical protein
MLDQTSPSLEPALEAAPQGSALRGAAVEVLETPLALLPPPKPRLRLDAAQRLWLDQGDKVVRVQPVRCFPWSSPSELVSLRDEHDAEHFLVGQLSELDAESSHALERAMLGVGFVLDVHTIESIEEDYEVRVWHTHTRHGKRTFQTKLDEWPWASPDGGHLVRDLSGDLFRLPPLDTLDKRTREWLWAYVG